jgi:malate dehydrogenase (oxaloacetate-decarboxylating)(NADP+)
MTDCLLEVIKKYKPSMLLGMTAVGGLFKEEMIRAMAANCDRPIIFPLSNPTTKAECTAEQAFEWTNGNCIFASGSPFDPVTMPDGRTVYPTQCNNMYVVLVAFFVHQIFSVLMISTHHM